MQRIRDLEDKTEIQRRQIKDLEEKVRRVKCLSEKKNLLVKVKNDTFDAYIGNINKCCLSDIVPVSLYSDPSVCY